MVLHHSFITDILLGPSRGRHLTQASLLRLHLLPAFPMLSYWQSKRLDSSPVHCSPDNIIGPLFSLSDTPDTEVANPWPSCRQTTSPAPRFHPLSHTEYQVSLKWISTYPSSVCLLDSRISLWLKLETICNEKGIKTKLHTSCGVVHDVKCLTYKATKYFYSQVLFVIPSCIFFFFFGLSCLFFVIFA